MDTGSSGAAACPRPYTRGELIADRIVHVGALGLAAVGLPILIGTSFDTGNPAVLVSLPLYAVGVFAMLTCSLLYNADWQPDLKAFLRRFDYAGILMMIAGTYSPFTLIKIGGLWGMGLFASVWALAVAGIILAFILPEVMDRAMIAFALAMGWCIVVAIEPLLESVTLTVLVLLAGGGMLYSVGVLFLMAKRILYHNAIWHGFVVTAAIIHFSAIAIAIRQ